MLGADKPRLPKRAILTRATTPAGIAYLHEALMAFSETIEDETSLPTGMLEGTHEAIDFEPSRMGFPHTAGESKKHHALPALRICE